MKKLVLIFSILLAALPQVFSINDPNLTRGWEHFANNRYREAEIHFKRALNGQYKAEAHISLAFTGNATNDEQLIIESMYEFFKVSSNPDPYMEALWGMWGGDENRAIMLRFLNDLVNSPNGKIRAMAHQRLGHYYRNINQFKKSTEQFSRTGAVLTWQVLGEFQNISESGFDKDFGAIANPERAHRFTNKHGATVQWFDIKAPLYSNWIDLEYYFAGNNSIIYSQTFCNSPVEQEVEFRLGAAGSLKVWVNDKLMFMEPEERDNNLDTYIFTVRLMKGHNRILIQTGASELEEHNFLLRITDSSGIPIEGLNFTTTVRPYPRDYRYESRVVPNDAEAYFLRKIEEYPDHMMYYLLINRLYLSKQHTYQALVSLRDARARFADCSYLTMLAMWAYSLDDNPTEHSKCLDDIKRKDPNNPMVLNNLFDEAISASNYREAREILAKMERLTPNSANVYSKRIELAGEEEEYGDMIRLINEAYRRYPNNYEFVNLRFLVVREVDKNYSGSIKVLQRYLKKNYDETAIRDLISAYLNIGQLPRAIALYELMIKNHPIAVGSYYRLAQIYYHTSNYIKAEDMVNECIRIAPYIARYHVLLGDIFSDRRQSFKAREAYEKGISFNPQNYEAREKLRKLMGQEDIFETFEKVDVYAAFENSPVATDYPDDNSIILVDVVQTVVYSGGGSQERHILVAKVFDTKGIDSWKEYTIPVYGNQEAIMEKMEVLKKNGSRIEALREGAHIVFPNLEEGDAIHLSWKVSNYYSGILSRNHWDNQYFSYTVPAQHISYQLLVPSDYQFNYVARNIELEPVITTHGTNKLYVWTANGLPAIREERYMPKIADIGSMLHVSSFTDWSTISHWYADLALAKAKVDFQIKELVKELFEGKEDLTDTEKVKEIYAYILRNIRYSSVPFLQSGLIPRKASRTLSQMQGDCKDVSILFVAMCKAVGIEATIVLVNTRDNGINSLPLPDIGFNHAIARVELEGKPYYVELTSDNLPFAAGLSSIKQVFALDIPFDRPVNVTAGVIDPPTRVNNDLIRKTRVTFSGDVMKVDKQNWRVGVEAAYFRSIFKEMGTDRREKRMQEMIIRQYPKIKLTALQFGESLHSLADTLDYTFSYEVPDIFNEVGRLQIFELPWSDKFENPPFMATDERKFPIDLWVYLDVETYREEMIIDIPAGKRVTDLPRNVTLSCYNADYTLTFRRAGNQIIVTRVLVIKVDRVMPEHYAEFKRFLGDVVRADKQQLGFTTGR